MNCEGFQTVAGGLARREILEVSERTSAMAHVEECERCGQTWNDQHELSEALRIVAEQMKSLQAPIQLEEKLRAAFRDRTFIRPIQSRPRRLRYRVGAAAAALLIASGVMAWHLAWRPQPPIEAKSKGGTAAPYPSPQPDQSQVVAGAGNPVPHPKRGEPSHYPPKPRQARRVDDVTLAKRPTMEPAAPLAASTETREVTTDFVALRYGSTLDLQDGGQLVRVELPRSALARFGLPMNMDRADERVKADVLVAADGLARAIRFVK